VTGISQRAAGASPGTGSMAMPGMFDMVSAGRSVLRPPSATWTFS
jgi:hypothetical protein